MKIKFILLFLFCTTTLTFAQTSEHLIFKGVPIDGTLSEYVSKMEEAGFTKIEIDDGLAMLQGDFASYKDCIIGVATLDKKDLVSKISIIFPESSKWSTLSSNYYYLKELIAVQNKSRKNLKSNL